MERKIVLGFALGLLLSLPAVGTAQELTKSVRSAGMGEAFTSVAVGTSAIYHNPAGAARAVMYALEGAYEYTPTTSVLSAAVVDSKTNPSIAAGVAYSHHFGHGESSVRGHDIRLSLAIPVLPERISIGVGGRYMLVKDTVLRMDSEGEEIASDVQLVNGLTLDAGVIFKASNQFHLGIVGKNLIDQCKQACEPTEARYLAPTTIAGGLGFSTEAFLIAADGGVNLTSADTATPIAGVGAEYLIQGMVPVRAGYEYKGAMEQHLLTFGVGWRSSAAGVDLGYQLDLLDTSNMFFMGSFSVYM